jgi:hypothetical protein
LKFWQKMKFEGGKFLECGMSYNKTKEIWKENIFCCTHFGCFKAMLEILNELKSESFSKPLYSHALIISLW